jgi:hypothetical protein
MALPTWSYQPRTNAHDGEFKDGGRARARDVQLVEIANMRSCILGKQTMLPRKTMSTPPAEDPIEFLHADICGPFERQPFPEGLRPSLFMT